LLYKTAQKGAPHIGALFFKGSKNAILPDFLGDSAWFIFLELRIKRDGKLSILGCKKTLARDRF
jgi:hypothetical protein